MLCILRHGTLVAEDVGTRRITLDIYSTTVLLVGMLGSLLIAWCEMVVSQSQRGCSFSLASEIFLFVLLFLVIPLFFACRTGPAVWGLRLELCALNGKMATL
ncbi:hypothetical protein V8C26DRAFT_394889 [Trichoderma gracile]